MKRRLVCGSRNPAYLDMYKGSVVSPDVPFVDELPGVVEVVRVRAKGNRRFRSWIRR